MAAAVDSLVKLREAIKGAQLLLVRGPRPDLTARVETAVCGWVDVVQLRNARQRSAPLSDRGVARSLRPRRRIFSVNDDVELAWLSGAYGVHLG